MDAATLLIACAWKAAVLVALATLMLRLWPRSSAAERRAAWAAVFVALLALPGISILWTMAPLSVEAIPAGRALLLSDTRTVITVLAGDDGLFVHTVWRNAFLFLLALWAGGVLLFLARLVLAYRAAHRLLGRAAHFPITQGQAPDVPVVSSPAVPVPMTIGILHPRIALPADALHWEPARLGRVLAHEAAHAERHDPLWKFLASIVCAIYWFHPFVWLAARAFSLEREHACDDAVLARGGQPSRYAADLLEFARNAMARPAHQRLPQAAIPMASPSRLEARIAAILDETKPRQTLRRTNIMIYTIALALLLLPLSALQSMAQSAPPGDLRADFARILMPAHQPAPALAPVAVRGTNRAPVAAPRPTAAQQPTGTLAPAPAPQPVSAQDSDPPGRIRVGGNVQKMKIIKMVPPKYPADAKAEKVQGIVRLKVRINQEGFVAETEIEQSPDDRLSASAQEAVSQWVYEPTLLNGKPVEVLTVVDVNYTLQ